MSPDQCPDDSAYQQYPQDTDEDDTNQIPKDMEHFIELVTDDNWNEMIYSQIIKVLMKQRLLQKMKMMKLCK